MASSVAMQRVAQAWCTPETEDRVMDTELAKAMADILDDYIDALRAMNGGLVFPGLLEDWSPDEGSG